MSEKEEKIKLVDFLENDFYLGDAIKMAVKEWSPGHNVTIWASAEGKLRNTLDSGNTSYLTEDIAVYELSSNFWNNQPLEINSVFSDEEYSEFEKWCKKKNIIADEEYSDYDTLQKYEKNTGWSWEDMLYNFLDFSIEEEKEELDEKIKELKEEISQIEKKESEKNE